ncbi:hypothetical protein FXF51_20005 [Nonomuraea sp. PA05]|uniref:hypothetical protein n=1 Tax=Nonomuraea sp. PA05 TaxID=2604466 RepID=UPI0011D7CD96|nr:hypothetical protein [Nonomuraea sp. PA05]TYB64746.1 hypothetical protein FXF51_20005 [Nonomuraea sp. PA05]
MIPIPTAAMLDAIRSRTGYVAESYVKLVNGARRDLPDDEVLKDLRAHWTKELSPTWVRLAGDLTTNPAGRKASGEEMAKGLPLIVETLNRLHGWVPGIARNPWFDGLIQRIEKEVVDQVVTGSPAAVESLKRCFGTRADKAAARFPAILGKFKALHAQTGKGPAMGFVYGPDLPGTMRALAHGQGEKAWVEVGRRLLNNVDGDAESAAALLHEVSHTLAQNYYTIDFAYRAVNAHYLLIPELAEVNAANYEQVAVDLLGGKPGLSAAELDLLRGGKGTLLEQVHALMSSRVIRAWIQAHNLYRDSKEKPLPSSSLSGLAAIPDGPEYKEVVTGLLDEFKKQMDLLIDRVNKHLTLGRDNALLGLKVVSTATDTAITLPPGWEGGKTPDQLAVALLEVVANELWPQITTPGAIPPAYSSMQIAGYASSVQIHETPGVRELLKLYFDSITRPAKA